MEKMKFILTAEQKHMLWYGLSIAYKYISSEISKHNIRNYVHLERCTFNIDIGHHLHELTSTYQRVDVIQKYGEWANITIPESPKDFHHTVQRCCGWVLNAIMRNITLSRITELRHFVKQKKLAWKNVSIKNKHKHKRIGNIMHYPPNCTVYTYPNFGDIYEYCLWEYLKEQHVVYFEKKNK